MERTRKICALLLALAFLATGMLGITLKVNATNQGYHNYNGNENNGGYYEGSATNPAPLHLTKDLQVAEGVKVPALPFNYTFTKISFNGLTSEAEKAKMPELSGSITYNGNESKVSESPADTTKDDYAKQSANLLNEVTFTQPGNYIYEVVEVAPTGWTETPTGSGIYTKTTGQITEDIKLSTAKYRVEIVVVNNSSETGTYVKYVAAKVEKTDFTGTGAPADGAKVNPGPDTDITQAELSAMTTFVNKYQKTKSVLDNPTTDTIADVLAINKVVAGDAGDKTRYFDFSVTVNNPTQMAGSLPVTYTAYIWDSALNNGAGGKVTNGSDNGVNLGSNGEISVTPGSALDFKLKHGQYLYFKSLPAGATYSATEKDGNIELNNNGEVVGHIVTYGHKENGEQTVTADKPKDVVIQANTGESNSFTATNTKNSSAPTGLFYDNLPYLVLLAVAALGLIVFVIKKTRRAVEKQ